MYIFSLCTKHFISKNTRRTEIFELKKLLPYSSYSVLMCSLVLTEVHVSQFFPRELGWVFSLSSFLLLILAAEINLPSVKVMACALI